MTFLVDGFGEVGEANLLGFIPSGDKFPADLQIGESCEGKLSREFFGTERIRITRTR